jgi:predicted dehydrogenase
MSTQPIRIGIVGAGANTRGRHIPGFRAIEGVELTGVVNRSAESTAKAAREFEIPKTYPNWQALIEEPDLDAVMVGTWPNLHCEISCAALEAGKHVLTEARMARSLAEARQMLRISQSQPNLVAQIVPSPFGLVQHEYLHEAIADGFLGEFRELVVIGATDGFWDSGQPLHWRQEREISGLNVLALGILHEAAIRFAPEPTRLFAQTQLFEPERAASPYSGDTRATIPDSVQIVTELDGGGRGLYHLGGVHLFGPGHQIHMYGSKGTIRLELGPQERLLMGRAGEAEMHEPDIPAEQRGGWRVEAEFIGAIRGEEPVRFTDFATGVKYMEFTSAVHKSAAEGLPVDLPLPDDASP